MKRFLLLLSVAIVAMSGSCKTITASKNSATEHRKLQAFNEIEINSTINVQFVQSSSDYSAIVAAPSNVLPFFVLEQDGKEITMRLKGDVNFKGDTKVVVTLYAPSVKSVEVNGASSFNSAGLELKGQKLELELNGASTVNIESLTAEAVEIEASGASDVDIRGMFVNSVEVEASGASKVELAGKASICDFEASGASGIHARGLEAISGKVDASGASTIKAKIGNVVSRKSSGASSISVN